LCGWSKGLGHLQRWVGLSCCFMHVAVEQPQMWLVLGTQRLGDGEHHKFYLFPFLCRYGNCDGNPDTGCEVNLNTSVSHCGSCNTPATPFDNAAAACVDGARALGTCNPGWVGTARLFANANLVRTGTSQCISTALIIITSGTL
jgi:hypothetical protein